MKTLLLLLTLVSTPSFAAEATRCADLPASQQAVFKAYNAFLDSGSELDGAVFIGAIAQYQTDIELYGDKTDPNYGNIQSVDLFESNAANLCVGDKRQGILEKRALAGDKASIRVVLLYSAVYLVDGAGAEDLGEIQDQLLKKFPNTVRAIEKESASFFKAHPIYWVNRS